MPIVVALGERPGDSVRTWGVQANLVDARPGLRGLFINPREHVGATGPVRGDSRVAHGFQVAEKVWADGFSHEEQPMHWEAVRRGKGLASILPHRRPQTSMVTDPEIARDGLTTGVNNHAIAVP